MLGARLIRCFLTLLLGAAVVSPGLVGQSESVDFTGTYTFEIPMPDDGGMSYRLDLHADGTATVLWERMRGGGFDFDAQWVV